MARSIEEIEQVITDHAAGFTELSELEANASIAQVWSYAKKVFAMGTAQIEQSQDDFIKEVEASVDDREPGGLEWYRERCFEYQHGDVLGVINNRPAYAVIDIDKQIVKHVSVVESGVNGALTIKVAAENFTPLTVDESAGFQTYINKTKVSGTLITVQSDAANQVAYDVTIEVDKSVINAAGERVDGSTLTPVWDALDAFHESIDFNDVLYLSRATDSLQAIEGVIDVEITESRYFDGSWQIIDRKYASVAGYVSLNTAQSNLNVI